MVKMSARIVVVFMLVAFELQLSNSIDLFKNSNGYLQCLTPKNRTGTCVPLNECSVLTETLRKYNIPKDPELLKYFQSAECGRHGNKIYVCCDNDAKICTTIEEKVGICIPFYRCSELRRYLDKNGYNDETINYVRHSECFSNDDEEYARVCCPLAHSLEGKPNQRPIQEYKTKNRDSMQSIKNGTDVIDLTEARNLLPKPGEEDGDCGSESLGDRIVNGQEADILDLPWMALLKYDSSNPWLCGGTLIHPRFVLTAAHCFAESDLNLIAIRLGEHDVSNESEDCDVDDLCNDGPLDIVHEKIIVHPEYDRDTKQNDIALVKLSKSAPFTDFIRPICLPFDPIEIPKDDLLKIAGWGLTEEKFQSDVKLKTLIPQVDMEECNKKLKLSNSDREKQICAGGGLSDTCQGDSGGPLIYTTKIGNAFNYQIGITSFGAQKCGSKDVPAIYTSVRYYMPWILKTIKSEL